MRRFAALCTLVAGFAVPAAAQAAPGNLDGTFSEDGLVSDHGNFQEFALAPDGSSLVAITGDGEGNVIRFGPDGLKDPDFGAGNRGTVADAALVFCCGGAATALAVRSDGRVVAGGQQIVNFSVDFGLTELQTSGASACALGGLCITTDFAGGEDRLTDVVVEPSGKTLAAGIVSDNGVEKLGVARYLGSGGLDGSFAEGGKLMLASGGVSTLARKAVVAGLPDGSVLLAGAGPGPDGSGRGDMLLAKFAPSGGLDTTFGGGDGWVTVDIAVRDDADSIAIAPDGSIYVGIQPCAFGLHTDCGAAVAKFTPKGEPDPSFGAGGLMNNSAGSKVAVASDGSVFTAGTTTIRPYFLSDFSLARHLPDGDRDVAFSADGVTSADFGLTPDLGSGLATAPGGEVVVGGSVSGAKLGLARFELAEGPPDMDADGRLDDADRCPERYARSKTGCPRVKRELKLKRAGGGRLKAKVRSELDLCERRQPLKLMRLRPGRDRRVARPRTSRAGSWRSGRLAPGRYRAKAKTKVTAKIARCAGGRTKAVRVG